MVERLPVSPGGTGGPWMIEPGVGDLFGPYAFT
jgi:hypothetical protein